MSEKVKLKCKIKHIKYCNPDNYYHVMTCNTNLMNKCMNITVVGHIINPTINTEILFWGKWDNHPKFGSQFKFDNYEIIMPRTITEIRDYLSNGAISGIGPVLANNIVDNFGEKTLEVLDNETDKLIEVNGIGEKILQKIKNGLMEFRCQRNLRFLLQEFEIPISYAPRIYSVYEDKSVEIIKENPYQMCFDINGFGFKTVDGIAQKIGFEKTSFRRLEAGIIYTLKLAYNEGHCFLTKQQLYKSASEILECEECYVVMTLDEMIKTEVIIKDEDSIYTKEMYYAEKKVASKLLMLMKNPKEKVKDFKPLKEISYDEKQILAINNAIENPVSIITGGPGTGKSTIIKEIVRYYRKKNILLAAPTGKAAKRINETTGKEAKTIHRLLEAKSLNYFSHNENNPLTGDVLIIDECSMIDIWLLYNLLKAVPNNMKIIFVGDKDQLPSVGPGNVLQDLIQSNRIPVTKLTKIFRQSENSYIAQNAALINQGKAPVISGKNSDFFFIPRTGQAITETIIDLVTKKIPDYFKINCSDIQVLGPMKKRIAGIEELNIKLQNKINPNGREIVFPFQTFRENDRVIQIVNNYEDNVFNGDTGIIKNIDEDLITIEFDENKIVYYNKSQLNQIMLSYALTIHKSQGSEFPVVIIPMTTNHQIMLQRNLLYTAITRAKKYVFLVGEEEAVKRCVLNDKVKKRNTKLIQRIEQGFL